MEKLGLYSEPKFNEIEHYLGEGELTKQTEFIKYVASKIKGSTDEEKVKNLMLWINTNLIRKDDQNDSKKFKKTAQEILELRERRGCSDSAVVFSTIARAMGIPTMQIICFDKDWGEDILKGKNPKNTRGHFYVAVYLKDEMGIGEWKLLDSDRPIKPQNGEKEDNQIKRLRKNDRNITRRRYAYAYVRDFRDIEIDGKKIDSISNMDYIQRKAFEESNKKDIDFNSEEVR